MVPAVEKAMVDSGIILVKYWLEVSPDEQTRRLESRIDDPRKIWKLSDMDLKSYTPLVRLLARPRRHVRAPPTRAWAPWYVAHTNDKKRGRLNIITHLLEPDPLRAARRHATSRCPARQKARDYASPTSRCGTSRRRSETESSDDHPQLAKRLGLPQATRMALDADLDEFLDAPRSRWMRSSRRRRTSTGPGSGSRVAMFVFDMEGSWQLPPLLEPLFEGLDAAIRVTPVMNGEDLQRELQAIVR